MRSLRRAKSEPVMREVDLADARDLALELAGLRPLRAPDPIALGVVLEMDETPWRSTFAWLRMRGPSAWTPAEPCDVLVTDRRLVVRSQGGPLWSLWWGSLVGFEGDLVAGHVVLDYGDGAPRLLSGSGVAVIAVAGVARLYGVEALIRHPALAALRPPASASEAPA